jgi:hypothetical protein
MGVQAGCEDLNVELIILVGMYAKVLDLIKGNRLIFGRRNVGGRVVLWICAESTDVHFASRDGTIGVDLHAIKKKSGNRDAYHVPPQQQMGLGTFGLSSEC